ncbi:MAG: tetratricopeptide repeat protein [Pseudomonadota bacterium]
MRRFLLALCIAAAASPVFGQVSLEACANPNLEAGDTIRFCQQALQDRDLRPNNRARVLTNLGVGLAEMGRHSEAIVNFGLASTTDPKLIAAYTYRARSNEALGNIQDALDDFAAALEAAPQDPEVWAARGAMLMRQRRLPEAEQDLTRALELDRDNLSARYNRGLARLSLGDAAAAEEDLDWLLSVRGDDVGALVNRGQARALQEKTTALEDFDRAITIAPDWGPAYYTRGRYHDWAGRKADADADYLRAFELGVSNPFLIERVRQISGN